MFAAVLDTCVLYPSVQRDFLLSLAGAIVTDNVKDFPTGKVPDHIQIIRPAVFSANTVCTSPEGALRALQQMSKRRRNPPQSVDDLLEILENRYGMVETVDLIVAVR
ncbi:hypothetical protein [Nocardia vermiculata]|uniref:VapC50 C-terminal domain-containing protein n=1 Tax=Nocardia vermiculata TaxID=257274 RepID=A0A846Y5Q4_9NOCA|nr:hypothetical protein [Nocardia vermiculata]NKY53242.1 hypothetical protein [Nocardia vermiculata]